MSIQGRRPFLHETPAVETPVAQSTSATWGILKRVFRMIGWTVFLLICSIACVVLFKISYPRPAHSLWAWLALAPLIWALCYLRGFWRSFFYAWLTGTGVYAALYYWIFITCRYGGGLSTSLSVAAWLGLSVLMAVQFAILGGSCFFLKRLKGWFPLLAAMGWVALEWLHEMLATYALGFPWFSLAYSQWNMPQLIQLASFTGAAGISFLVSFTGISVGYGLAASRARTGIWQFVLAAVVFLSTYGYGMYALKHLPPNSLLRLRAAVMQPNIDQYKKWTPEFEAEIENTFKQMSAGLQDKQIMLAVWPENVTPGAAQEDPYRQWMHDTSALHGAWQLVGSYRAEQDKQYVSAYLFDPQGMPVSFYDKRHLVPFGETIPFEKTVLRLFPNVDVLGELGLFSAGQKRPLLHIGQIAFGTTICYESVFSHLWREQAREGARFFVNITNDAWFFDTDAPYQHIAVSVLRAVETRRPVLRAANTGISAVIAPSGAIMARASLGTQAVLVEDIALPLGPDMSFYVRWHNWFAWLCAVIYFTILISVIVFMCE